MGPRFGSSGTTVSCWARAALRSSGDSSTWTWRSLAWIAPKATPSTPTRRVTRPGTLPLFHMMPSPCPAPAAGRLLSRSGHQSAGDGAPLRQGLRAGSVPRKPHLDRILLRRRHKAQAKRRQMLDPFQVLKRGALEPELPVPFRQPGLLRAQAFHAIPVPDEFDLLPNVEEDRHQEPRTDPDDSTKLARPRLIAVLDQSLIQHHPTSRLHVRHGLSSGPAAPTPSRRRTALRRALRERGLAKISSSPGRTALRVIRSTMPGRPHPHRGSSGGQTQ